MEKLEEIDSMITLKEFFYRGYLPKHLRKHIYADLASGRLTGYKCGRQWHVDPDEIIVEWRNLYSNRRKEENYKSQEKEKAVSSQNREGPETGLKHKFFFRVKYEPEACSEEMTIKRKSDGTV